MQSHIEWWIASKSCTVVYDTRSYLEEKNAAKCRMGALEISAFIFWMRIRHWQRAERRVQKPFIGCEVGWMRMQNSRQKSNLNFLSCFSTIFYHSPILTILMPSSSKNFNATETFSSFCERNVGRLLYLGMRFCDKTSIKAIKRRPSDRSVSRLLIERSIVLRCSFAQRQDHVQPPYRRRNFRYKYPNSEKKKTKKNIILESQHNRDDFNKGLDEKFGHVLKPKDIATWHKRKRIFLLVFSLIAFAFQYANDDVTDGTKFPKKQTSEIFTTATTATTTTTTTTVKVVLNATLYL
ncbi:hypothetical protein GQX74_015241 [Glossina fuscipes]|nr:hypothetical protein GQX74_015241 [Glossina fuscipes]